MLKFSSDPLVETIDIIDYASLIEIDGVTSRSYQLRIPIFQRETVWTDEQYTSLWDSILRYLPIGTIIVTDDNSSVLTRSAHAYPGSIVKPRASTTDDLRASTTDDSQASTTHGLRASTTHDPKQFYIIDGQQRSVAIAVGLTPIDKNPDMGCRLWLDLMPPKNTAVDSPKFQLYVCSKVHPWGEGSEDNYKIDDARKKLIDKGLIDSKDWDYVIPLKHTFPIKAKYPVPFAELVDFILSSKGSGLPSHKLSAILSNPSLNMPLKENNEDFEKIMKDTNINKLLQELFDCFLNNRHRLRLVIIKVDFSDSADLLTAFIRLNTKGTELKPAELFYSAVKHELPQAHKTVQDVWSSCDHLFSSLDIVYVTTRLAIKEVCRALGVSPDEREITELSLEGLKSIQNDPKLPKFWNDIKSKLDFLLGMTSSRNVINEAFLELKSILCFDKSENPNGLPIPLVLRAYTKTKILF